MNNRHRLKTLWGKEEIAHDEQFLLFPQCFLLNQIIVSPFAIFFTSYLCLLLNWKSLKLPFVLSSAKSLVLAKAKILLCGKELTLSQTTNSRLFQTERLCRRQFQI